MNNDIEFIKKQIKTLQNQALFVSIGLSAISIAFFIAMAVKVW